MPGPFLCQRKPATTQSAVRACLTLTIDRSPGWYGWSSRLATTPSRPAPSKCVEPLERHRAIARRGRQVDGRPRAGQRRFQPPPAFGERRGRQVFVALGQQIPGDERRRDLARQHRDARRGRVNAQQQRREVEARGPGDDDLAVEHGARGQGGPQRRHQLGEVALHRFEVAALQVDARRRRGTPACGSRPTWVRRASRRLRGSRQPAWPASARPAATAAASMVCLSMVCLRWSAFVA